MANKWAVQNGNWSDGSTWNDGFVPTADDDVEANGYTITLDTTTILAHKLTNIIGGEFIFSIDISINADLECGSIKSVLRQTSDSKTVVIVGNMKGLPNISHTVFNNSAGGSLTFTGNTSGGYIFNLGLKYNTVYIEGIVDCSEKSFCNRNNNCDVYSFNGKWIAGKPVNQNETYYTYFTNFNGTLKIIKDCVLRSPSNANQSNITGTVDLSEYTGSQYPLQLRGYFHDLQFINRPDYNVPESVVLEGYEYGDKVGTLKTVPDNVTIVNLTEQEVNRVKNCATVSTVQKCFEDFKE